MREGRVSASGWIRKTINKLKVMEGFLTDSSCALPFRHCSAGERKSRQLSTFDPLGRSEPSPCFFFFFHSPWVGEMSGGTSSGDDDHFTSHISGALGSEDTLLWGVESPPVDWSEEEVKEEISIPRVTRGKSKAVASISHVSRT